MEMFKNDYSNTTSGMSVGFFIIIFFIMLVWAILSIKSPTGMVDIPSGVMSVLGIAFGGKAGQKGLEAFARNAGMKKYESVLKFVDSKLQKNN